MKYYKTWQEALTDFITKYGQNYEQVYSLMAEFELILRRNIKGAYYLREKI